MTIDPDNFHPALFVSQTNTKNVILEQYADVFSGILGTLPGEAHLSVDASVQPVVLPPRPIPVSLRKSVQTKLKRLHDLKVISPIEELTDWVSQMVAVEKNSDCVHICIDPRPINRALLREHYHLPTLEEILLELNKAKVFSTCDLHSVYWHIPLDTESQKHTCTQSLFGRFVWNRLPFGLKVSSEFSRNYYMLHLLICPAFTA